MLGQNTEESNYSTGHEAKASQTHQSELPSSSFAGSTTCQQCHEDEYRAWQSSDHRHAFAKASTESVRGEFNGNKINFVDGQAAFSRGDNNEFVISVNTDQGQRVYSVQYTLGHYPLQQYVLEPEPGRYQVFALAWDTRSQEQGGQRWIELQPDESVDHDNPFHWSGYFQNLSLIHI